MELIHYSAKPLEGINNPDYQPKRHFKPAGLWFSTNKHDGWRNWCNSVDFSMDRFNYKTTIKFKNDAKILQITDKRGVDKLFRRYGVAKRDDKWAIDWKKITTKYDAIYMPKYFNDYRKKYPWYDTWDCASGCVWNKDAVKIVKTEPVAEAA